MLSETKDLLKLKISKNPNKLGYRYILTPRGIAKKTELTINFMKRKLQEYDELHSEMKDED